MKTDTPRTDVLEFNYATSGGGWGKPFDFARELERENARLRELLTLLEVAGEGMSEECASSPHIAKWDAARNETGLFLRSAERQR